MVVQPHVAVLVWRSTETGTWTVLLRTRQEMEPNPHRLRGRISGPALSRIEPIRTGMRAVHKTDRYGTDVDIINDPWHAADEGITFNVADAVSCIRFTLVVDTLTVAPISIGRAEAHPATSDFELCP